MWWITIPPRLDPPEAAAKELADKDTGLGLHVTPTPVARWLLDGKIRTDRLPAVIRGISPGLHQLQIEAPGFRSETRAVTVEPGKSLRVDIKLAPIEGPTIVKPLKISVSGTHASSDGYTFVASNLTDGDLTTSWQPNGAVAENEQLWVQFDFETHMTVRTIAIGNGFQVRDKHGDQFVKNSRIRKARIRFSDGAEIPIQFKSDTRGLVRFEIPNKRAQSFRLIVDGVSHGARWDDLAISEIEVTGSADQ